MDDSRLGAIFSTARAGSTWLGAVVASHPDVAYRFEPFSRLVKSREDFRAFFQEVVSDDTGDLDLPRVYAALLAAYPQVDKPPFFSKSYRARAVCGKVPLWYLTRKGSGLGSLYSWLYTPLDSPLVVFKEVAHVRLLEKMVKDARVPLVYLVRHPCGVVSSKLQGQAKGLMPTGRQKILKDMIVRYDPGLAEVYGSRLNGMSAAQKEALLWRLEVERALRVLDLEGRGLVVIYEELCDDPIKVSQKVLDHFGLGMSEQTNEFLIQSTNPNASGKGRQGEKGINRYFTVYRDPKVSRDKWKNQLSREDREGVFEVVRDSPAYALGSQNGCWE